MKSSLKILIFSLLLYFVLETAIFRTPGFYLDFVNPRSYFGQFRTTIQGLEGKIKNKKIKNAIIVGDSRIAEGLSSNLASERLRRRKVQFLNGAIFGASPRVWYHLLTILDPKGDQLDYIFLPVLDYEDRFDGLSSSRRLLDIKYLAPSIKLMDAWPFIASFWEVDDKKNIFFDVFLPGRMLKEDILQFIRDPDPRFKAVAHAKSSGFRDRYQYKPSENGFCLLYTSPSPRDKRQTRMPSSA